jgi:hypothetical protein
MRSLDFAFSKIEEANLLSVLALIRARRCVVNRRTLLAVLGTLVAACDRANLPVAPSAVNDGGVAVVGPGVVYSGRGTAIDATVLGVNQKVCDTGPLPSSGGQIENSVASFNNGLINAKLLYCYTRGANNQAISEAAVGELILTYPGLSIFADVLSSMAAARCNGSPSTSGSSAIARLNINGQAVVVRGTPNQTITIPGIGSVILNEQSGFVSPFGGSKTVTALRVIVTGVLDIKFARSHADIDCG